RAFSSSLDAKPAAGGKGWPGSLLHEPQTTGCIDAPVDRRPVASPRGARDAAHDLRKEREIALLQRSLREPLALPVPRGIADVVAQKLRIASALRAERSLESWSITETARPEVHEWPCGAFRLSFGYQRADLVVQGPSVYPHLETPRHGLAEET